jgi:AcrR family transcriptional regulator
MAIRRSASPLRAAEGTPGGVRGRLRRFPTPNEHERIHAAAASVIVAKGYGEARIEEICVAAEVSAEAFHEHFPGKLEAVLSAVETAADCVMADCQAAVARASTWPEQVWAATVVFTDWAACEPAFAELALIEMMKAGPPAQELMDSLVDAFALFLAPGYSLAGERTLQPGSLDAAIGAALLALLRAHVLHESPRTMPAIAPELACAALAPFLGAAAAADFVAKQLAAEGD